MRMGQDAPFRSFMQQERSRPTRLRSDMQVNQESSILLIHAVLGTGTCQYERQRCCEAVSSQIVNVVKRLCLKREAVLRGSILAINEVAKRLTIEREAVLRGSILASSAVAKRL